MGTTVVVTHGRENSKHTMTHFDAPAGKRLVSTYFLEATWVLSESRTVATIILYFIKTWKMVFSGFLLFENFENLFQSVNKFGGYKVQGRDEASAQLMINEALALEAAGADFILLECVPASLAKALTQTVSVPVIGIGAGNGTDGQVLVSYDMLGLTQQRMAKFVKNYMAQNTGWESAVAAYIADVKSGQFPAPEHCFE